MRFEITAPTGYDGEVAGVRFEGGRAVVDDRRHRAALAYFRRRPAYRVTEAGTEPVQAADGQGEGEVLAAPPATATRAELDAFAARIGVDQAEVKAAGTKADVRDLIDDRLAALQEDDEDQDDDPEVEDE